jgi:glutamate/aspartate transport system substrate-binding protein
VEHSLIMRLLRLFTVALLGGALLAASAMAQELTGTLKKVKESKAITLGYREASIPFSYLTAKGVPIGYSIDLCMAIIDQIKEELGKEDIAVKFSPVNSQNRIDLVVNGTVDLECGSTTNNLQRQKQVAFSPVTFVSGTKLLVKRPVRIKSYRDLKNKSVVVTDGTTNQAAMKVLSDKEGLNIKFIAAKDHGESFHLLNNNGADAFATDDALLYGFVATSGHPKDFQVVGDFLSYDPYGVMYRKGDAAFAEVVQRTFERLASTREIEDLYNKWFVKRLPTGETIGLPMSAQLRSLFQILGLPES